MFGAPPSQAGGVFGAPGLAGEVGAGGFNVGAGDTGAMRKKVTLRRHGRK